MCQTITESATRQAEKAYNKDGGKLGWKVVRYERARDGGSPELWSFSYYYKWKPGVNVAMSSRWTYKELLAPTRRKKVKFEFGSEKHFFEGAGIYVYRKRSEAERTMGNLSSRVMVILPVMCHARDLLGANKDVAIFRKVRVTDHGYKVLMEKCRSGKWWEEEGERRKKRK